MTILGVAGASGGLGCSTLAVALGVVASERGLRAVVVDGDTDSGGVQVTAGVEHLPGHRWTELTEVDGLVDGERLLAHLPVAGETPILSGGRSSAVLDAIAPESISPSVFGDVLGGLEAACDLVVVDWSRVRPTGPGVGLLLVGLSPRGLADAEAWLAAPIEQALGGVIVRSRKPDDRLAVATADRVGRPLLGTLTDDRRVRVAERRGDPPGAGRGRLHRLAVAVVTAAMADVPDAHTGGAYAIR